MSQIATYFYKLVVVGDPSVGKTSLIKQYTDKKFDESYLPTIGADFTIKQLEFKEATIIRKITLSIWDMGGHQRFDRIRDHYYLGANAAFLIFDITRKNTFKNLNTWFNDVESHSGTIPFIIVANKNDLPNKAVSKSEMELFSSSKNVKIIETSAKTGENVEKLFDIIARDCYDLYDKTK